MRLLDLPSEILFHCIKYLIPTGDEVVVKYQPVYPVSSDHTLRSSILALFAGQEDIHLPDNERRNPHSFREVLLVCQQLTAIVRPSIYRENTFRFAGLYRASNLSLFLQNLAL